MRNVTAVALLTACSPASRWESTSAVCAFPPATLDAASLAAPPAYPSEACVDAVFDDLGVDRSALLAADRLEDPYGLVWGEDMAGTRVGDLLWAVHPLLALDLGRMGAIDGRWAGEAFRRAVGGADADPVTQVLYDYAVGEIGATTTEPLDAAAGLRGRTLVVGELPVGIGGTAVLIHEARHRRGPDHVSCGGEPVCDRTDDGAVGFQLAVHEIAQGRAADELMARTEAQWLEVLQARILPP